MSMSTRVTPNRNRTSKLTAQQATAALRKALANLFREAAEWTDSDREAEAPGLAVRASAGLGKTEAVLEALTATGWDQRRVLMLLPSVELCDELAARARAKGVPVRVVRGRSQLQPGEHEGGAKMCAKSGLAEALAALGQDVTNTLCRTKAERTESGEAEQCPHAATCPYLAQLQQRGPGLILAAHQYVSLTVEGLKADSLDLLVIDESFWASTCRQGRVQTSRFTAPRGPGDRAQRPQKGESREAQRDRLDFAEADHRISIARVRDAIRTAEDAEEPLSLVHFRDQGLTRAHCTEAAAVEYSRLGFPNISAGMGEAEQNRRIQAAMTDEALSFASVWKRLGEELDLARHQLVSLRRNREFWNAKAGQMEDVLETFGHAKPRITGIPVVLLDADLDPEITRQFYPAAADRVLDLDVEWQNVRVRQVIDRAVSKNMLAGGNPRQDEQQRHSNRRDDLWNISLDMAERHAHPLAFSGSENEQKDARARRPILITYKRVEDSWADAGKIEHTVAKLTPRRNALPFDIAHLGDIRGKDTWKHASGIIVAGRPEPSVRDVEAMARCVFYADPRHLDFIQPTPEQTARYQQEERKIRLRSGEETLVQVSCHPDPLVDAVLRQIREAEVRQALARIRPVHRKAENPCEIIIATCVPVPGVTVDEVCTWRDLVPDRMRQMEIAGFIPNLAADCLAAYPSLFTSAAGVRKARSRSRSHATRLGVHSSDIDIGCDRTHIKLLYGNGHTPERFIAVEYVRIKEEGNRGERSGSGMVRALPGEAAEAVIARVRAALPDAERIALVGPLPDPQLEPDLAEHMRAEAISWLGEWLETSDPWISEPEHVLDRMPPPWITQPQLLRLQRWPTL